MPDLSNLLQYGIAGALMLAVFTAIVRGALVPRKQHDEIVGQIIDRYNEMRDDRNYWRESARSGRSATERAIGITEAVVKPHNGKDRDGPVS